MNNGLGSAQSGALRAQSGLQSNLAAFSARAHDFLTLISCFCGIRKERVKNPAP